MEPPDPIPNSEVKRISVDDSVGSPHAKVDHPQGLILDEPSLLKDSEGFFLAGVFYLFYLDDFL